MSEPRVVNIVRVENKEYVTVRYDTGVVIHRRYLKDEMLGDEE